MPSLPIIKHFNIFKNILFSILPCQIIILIDQFCFQRMKERLCVSIIITVALTAHALKKTISGKK